MTLALLQILPPAEELHEPGDSHVDHDAAPDVAAVVGDDAQDVPPEDGADGLAEWLAKVQKAIRGDHGQDHIRSQKTGEGVNQIAPEEQLHGEEVTAISQLVQRDSRPSGPVVFL